MKNYDFSICVSNHATGTEKWYNSDDYYSYDDMHDAIVDDIGNDETVSYIKDIFGGETESFYRNTAVELLTNKFNVNYDNVDELLQFINVEELVDYRYRFEITKTTNFVFWF